VRAAVLASTGQPVGFAKAAMADQGTGTHDPWTWAATCRAVLARLGELTTLDRIGTVAVDGTSGTLLALDADGARWARR
jgi:sugar (pentulose or hexulose) kinase